MTLTMTGGISTVNAKELMAVPSVFVTVTRPVDAPTGTRATRLGPRRREDGDCHAVERHLIARRRSSKAEAVNGHRCVYACAAWCDGKEPDTRTSRREPLNGQEIIDLIVGVDRDLSLSIDHAHQSPNSS